jgi:8-oxo-dGTP pyrophosphatase MutT (NUDIX family)
MRTSAALAFNSEPDTRRPRHRDHGADKVLLVRHSYVRGWHLSGGGVERDENLEQALKRELLEESGIELTRKPCLHGIFSNFERSVGDHIAVYVVRDWTRVSAFSSGFEIIENRFFELDSLPDGLIGGPKRRLFEASKSLINIP